MLVPFPFPYFLCSYDDAIVAGWNDWSWAMYVPIYIYIYSISTVNEVVTLSKGLGTLGAQLTKYVLLPLNCSLCNYSLIIIQVGSYAFSANFPDGQGGLYLSTDSMFLFSPFSLPSIY